MSDDKLRADVERAQHAKNLIEDPLLAQAFDGLDAAYTSAWKATKVAEEDARERLWQAIQIVGIVRTQLSTWLANGSMAQAEIDRLNALGERKKVLGVF